MIAPKRFVQRLKKDNELFRSYMHQASPSFTAFVSFPPCQEKTESSSDQRDPCI